MITTPAGVTFDAFAEGLPTGLVGTLEVRVTDLAGAVVVAPRTTGITEPTAGTGVYRAVLPSIPVPGKFLVYFRNGATFRSEALDVTAGLGLAPLDGSPEYPEIAEARRRSIATQRVVVARNFTASVTFGDDEDETPEGDVTLTLVNAAGVVIAGPVTADATEIPTFTVPISSSVIPQLDLLAAIWASDLGVTITTVDVRARRLFTIPRATAQFPELADYAATRFEQERLAAEDFLEDRCGLGLAPQFAEVVVPAVPAPAFSFGIPEHRTTILLPHPFVSKLRGVSVDGVALTDDELALVALDPSGIVSYSAGLNGRLVIAYEHGASLPDAGRACLILARHRLITGPLDDRAIGLPVEGGGVISLLTPGLRGSITGIPEVDVFISSNNYRIPGVA